MGQRGHDALAARGRWRDPRRCDSRHRPRAGFVQDSFTARRQSGRPRIAIDQLDADLTLEIANLTR